MVSWNGCHRLFIDRIGEGEQWAMKQWGSGAVKRYETEYQGLLSMPPGVIYFVQVLQVVYPVVL